MDKPINILYMIDFWAAPGGTERHLSLLLDALDRTRFKCTVAVFNYQPNALAEKANSTGIEIAHFPVARYYTPQAALQGIRLRKFIRDRAIDIVQTFHYKSDVYGTTVARLAGVKHIIASKRDAADYKKPFHFLMHRLVRPFTERYIAVSEVVARVVSAKERVPEKLISVIYNGLDASRYPVPDAAAKARAKGHLGFGPADFVIGMSAWLRPEKDHQLLLDAFAELVATAPNARLVLVGGGPAFERYSQWVAGKRFASSIRLVGPVDDVRPYLQAFDVACLVPRMNEGFSNSILEKMASGLPVIATDVGGNKEAVLNEVNGFVIAPGDRRGLVSCLRRLHGDERLRYAMGAASRERVERLFSLAEMTDRHARLYESLVHTSGEGIP